MYRTACNYTSTPTEARITRDAPHLIASIDLADSHAALWARIRLTLDELGSSNFVGITGMF
jgi:hypothetical protein